MYSTFGYRRLIGACFVFLVILVNLDESLVHGQISTSSPQLSNPTTSTVPHVTHHSLYTSWNEKESKLTDVPENHYNTAPPKELATQTTAEEATTSDVGTTTTFPISTTTSSPNDNDKFCTMPENADDLTQNQFSTFLTRDCRYDRLTKPHSNGPLEIGLQLDIRHIEAADQLLLKFHVLVQYSYLDERLRYDSISPRRGYMLGEDVLKSRIWVPHMVIINERDVSIMGLEGKDVFVSISPKGEVIYSYRMSAMVYCWMNLKKFPFDEQVCNLRFQSWTYNASQLLLRWEEPDPVKVASPLHLTEFTLEDFKTLETLEPAPVKGGFSGNFSTLNFRFRIAREVGYYIMDYFIPSIMLVCTSWVTFWLQADNTAPRVTLGTSTMLSFITLASGQSKTLPKVSYIKVSEIWFLGCTFFIFASMVEFAFVNIIWRRRKKVELKKVNSKYILKSTLTPRLARKELQQSSSMTNLHKAHSCSSLNGRKKSDENNGNTFNNYLTVHSFSTIPKITTSSDENLVCTKNESSTTIDMPENENADQHNSIAQRWTTMTPQEVAGWIDKRSRLLFPVAFLIFNIVFWTIVFCF